MMFFLDRNSINHCCHVCVEWRCIILAYFDAAKGGEQNIRVLFHDTADLRSLRNFSFQYIYVSKCIIPSSPTSSPSLTVSSPSLTMSSPSLSTSSSITRPLPFIPTASQSSPLLCECDSLLNSGEEIKEDKVEEKYKYNYTTSDFMKKKKKNKNNNSNDNIDDKNQEHFQGSDHGGDSTQDIYETIDEIGSDDIGSDIIRSDEVESEEIDGGCHCAENGKDCIELKNECICIQRMNGLVPYHEVKGQGLVLNMKSGTHTPIFECIPGECNCLCFRKAKYHDGKQPQKKKRKGDKILLPKSSQKNILVQLGPTLKRLQIFRCDIAHKGYGIRTLEAIPKGTFICEYTGEIISDRAADERLEKLVVDGNCHQNQYILVFREIFCNMTRRTNIDATCYGNLSRFFNHSCDPNMIIIPVRVESFHPPRLAFFSNREISEMEELCFDYGIENGLSSEVKCQCHCATCVGFMPYCKQL